jgi:hypothetical protein
MTTANQSAIDYINANKSGMKTYSRHGLYHVAREVTGKILGGSRQNLEMIARAVGGTYLVKRRRGYIVF